MNKILVRKSFTSSNNILFPQIKSVINLEREDFYPFLHPIVKGYLPTLRQNSSSYAKVFPKDVNKFLETQAEQFKKDENIEVLKFIFLKSRWLL
jgi:hypothetical protein